MPSSTWLVISLVWSHFVGPWRRQWIGSGIGVAVVFTKNDAAVTTPWSSTSCVEKVKGSYTAMAILAISSSR